MRLLLERPGHIYGSAKVQEVIELDKIKLEKDNGEMINLSDLLETLMMIAQKRDRKDRSERCEGCSKYYLCRKCRKRRSDGKN